MQECHYIVVVMTDSYLESLEQQEGRPFLELKAAVSCVSSHRIICVHQEQDRFPSSQKAQCLRPADLRKAFLMKPLVFYENLGHMELFENLLCRHINVEHDADLMQHPMSAKLEEYSLGQFIRPLALDAHCTSMDNLLVIREALSEMLNFDKWQAQQFDAMITEESLSSLFGVHGLGDFWKRLKAKYERDAATPTTRQSDKGESRAEHKIVGSVYELRNLDADTIQSVCMPSEAPKVLKAVARMQRMDEAELEASIKLPFIDKDEGVKELVAKLWSPGEAVTSRLAAADMLRKMCLSSSGLEVIQNAAGLESFIKLVLEGPPNEKVAALWSLRNFAMSELYRSRMGNAEVLSMCSRVLDDTSLDSGVHRAATSLLQMLTTANSNNVKTIVDEYPEILHRLIGTLYCKHRGLKYAALATLANLATKDKCKVLCAKLRAVPRLVALLEPRKPDIAAMAVAALNQLVVKDVNRLKTWRAGGIEKLKVIVDLKLPRVSDVASETIQILMAGPRIHPRERFTTASGRRLTADEMRTAIQRLNVQDSYLLNVNMSMASYESASPSAMGALRRRPATASQAEQSPLRGITRLVPTKISRCDFERPFSAMPASGKSGSPLYRDDNEELRDRNAPSSDLAPSRARSAERYQRVWTPDDGACSASDKYYDVRAREFVVSPLDPKSFCSDFGRRLSSATQKDSCDRLTYSKVHGYKRPSDQNSVHSSWHKKPQVRHSKAAGASSQRRADGRFYSAMASKRYRTETGKLVDSQIIQGAADRMSRKHPSPA